jgi:hypothetical protein
MSTGCSAVRRSAEEEAVRRELPAQSSQLDLSRLAPDELRSLAASLRHQRTQCGCKVGEVATLGALVAVGAWWIRHGLVGSVWSLATAVGATVVSIVGVAVAGKVAGIAVARSQYHLNVRSLHRRLS